MFAIRRFDRKSIGYIAYSSRFRFSFLKRTERAVFTDGSLASAYEMTLVPAREGQVLVEYVPYVCIEMLLRDGATEESISHHGFCILIRREVCWKYSTPCREFLGLLILISSCICTCGQ